MSAWNGWYHVTGGTYGTWLRGDARGWRDRKHRTHVEGDYRHPPPKGTYDDLLEQVRASMEHPPMKLGADERRRVGQAMVEKLLEMHSEVLSFALDAVHYHFLVRFPPISARAIVGKAKLHAYHELAATGPPRKLWAKRCRVQPIDGRAHQLRTYRYVRDPGDAGAWVWSFKQGAYWKDREA